MKKEKLGERASQINDERTNFSHTTTLYILGPGEIFHWFFHWW